MNADAAEPAAAAPAWGGAAAPLLPRWHRQAFAGVVVPAAAGSHLPAVRTLDNTGIGWRRGNGRVSTTALRALAAAVEGFPPPPQTVVAADRSALLALPLRARTRSAADALPEGGPVTVAALLALPRFGTFALLDAMCAAEARQHAASRTGPARLPDIRRRCAAAVASVTGLIARGDDVDEAVAERRLASDPAESLVIAAAAAGCSRETIRRRERRLRAAVGDAPAEAGGWIRHRLGPATAPAAVDEAVASCAAGAAGGQPRQIAEKLIRAAAGYRPAQGGMLVTDDGAAAVAEIAAAAARLSDDAGIVTRSALVEGFAGRPFARSLDTLCTAAGLCERRGLMHVGPWTAAAAVKAALIEAGQPTDVAALASIAEVTPARTAAVLAKLPSVAKTDKSRWALREWRCGEYLGIAEEMKARIEALGGEASMPLLATELSELYGVARDSVWSIAHTPQFVIDADTRKVSVAASPSAPLGDLDDVVSGRDTNGDPYWEFRVSAAQLRGFSIPSVPGEVAAALGVEITGRRLVQVRNPKGNGPVSVIWRATCITGAEIGRASRVLASAGARPGRIARLVLHSDGAVSFAVPPSAGPACRASP